MAIKEKEKKNISWINNDIIAPEDDIFAKLSKEENIGDAITEIALSDLLPHHNHTYKVKEDSEMEELVESIKANGVINPILVRRYKGKYEIISGHRRSHASKLAGLEKVPCIILDIDDDTSDIYMNQSNKYRENISPSEKAWGYRIEFDARKRQGSLPQDLDVYDKMADDGSDSVSTIKRLIRLTYLRKELLDMVDEGKQLKISQGVLLAKLSSDEQDVVLKVLTESGKTLSLKQAEKLRDMHDSRKKITKEVVDGLIGNTFSPRTSKPSPVMVDITAYLPDTIKTLSKDKQNEFVIEAIRKYSEYILSHAEELDKFI